MRARGGLVLAWLCVATAASVAAQGVSPPVCPQAAAGRCFWNGSGVGEYIYTVDGTRVRIEFADGGHFYIKCLDNLTLTNSALPRFDVQLRVKSAFLNSCPVAGGSYSAALEVLNVVVLEKLTVMGPVHIGRPQLARLEGLASLMLVGAELETDTLDAMPGLQRLHLQNLRVPSGALDTLPSALQVLEMDRTGASLTAAQLRRLPELREVLVRDSERAAVEPAGALHKIALEAPTSSAHVPHRLLPSLRILVLKGWDERSPKPWQDCDQLEELYTNNAAAETLPADWLRACPNLKLLSLRAGRLRALPAGLLDAARDLHTLDLLGNRLHALPSGLFAVNKALRSLNLSSNNFTKELFASLETVTSLNELRLNNNVHLTSACGGDSDSVRGISMLKDMKNLTELSLRNTSAKVICRDWRDNMLQLQTLDLSKNPITVLTYTDLQFGSSVVVNLSGSNVTRLLYSEQDYNSVVRGESRASADIRAKFALVCDCHAYWAAAALRARPHHVRLQAVRCAAGGDLAAAPDARLTCPAPQLCAPACHCATRPHAAPPTQPPAQPPTQAPNKPPQHALHVRCANVTHMPRLAAAAADYAQSLQLSDNNISHVGVNDLPPHILELDLRRNQISRLDVETATALASGPQQLWLGGNPLACDCRAEPALSVLRAAAALRDNATCPAQAQCGAAPRTALLLGGVLLALGAAAALLALLALPAARLRIKLALHAWGWLPARESDDGLRFDAFVSFSHGDERFVREQLVARLESGPAPYRLCLHYRDWAPGGWIPAQIAGSVRASRRTLAVVSEHFLRSAWACAELREAHALALAEREPRLVVLLLEDPARLPLDDKLRGYLASNTYVRWGDPWFWQKLRRALPRGRCAPPEPLPPAGVGPAPPAARELLPKLPCDDQESLNLKSLDPIT
ncbi:unnamed protein product [Chrysodeixis includens]|uniref:TIR domain-containing protein n=1 Tax=Chrysodeixis includens TaxID=689277 RepID=A0A9P0BPR8_CHRIL|nr:unnamed protein product [Chrysodeixis includens]